MKVSIIIPIYNVAKYIVRCLDSVTAQTYQNIECILIDDCGSDNSIQIAQQYIHNYQGHIDFKIVQHKHNRGLSAARNTGIESSTGTYLYFLDSDDSIIPESIETLIKLFKKYPDIDFAQGNILAEDGSISSYGYKFNMPEYTCNKEELYKIMLSQITTVAWNRLIKRNFVIKYHLYFPEGFFTEDMFWGYFIAKHVKAASFTHKGLYYYYINEGSMMTSPKNHYKWFTSRLWTTDVYLDDIRKYGSNKYQRQYIAINLLSCLVELKAIKSLKDYCRFWNKILKISFSSLTKLTWHRVLLLLTLLPPVCFLVSNNNIRWRIQQHIISHI